MVYRVLTSLIWILIFSYCTQEEDSLNSLILQWVQKNPRLTEDVQINNENKVLGITLNDTCKVGSPALEDFSSQNLVYEILSQFPEDSFDSILINYKLPLYQAKYVGKDEPVTKEYIYIC